ncbi:MAG: YjbQ family protein [Candidatus Dormibacteria bacterium]
MMETRELVVDTTGRRLVDLSGDMREFCKGRGDGLVHAFCPHATAALVLMERGAGGEEDLLAWIDAQLPRADLYRHRHGPLGHGRDHLLPALFGSSVSVPVRSGVPLLGTWQTLLLLDTNGENNRRQVLLSFLGDRPD